MLLAERQRQLESQSFVVEKWAHSDHCRDQNPVTASLVEDPKFCQVGDGILQHHQILKCYQSASKPFSKVLESLTMCKTSSALGLLVVVLLPVFLSWYRSLLYSLLTSHNQHQSVGHNNDQSGIMSDLWTT